MDTPVSSATLDIAKLRGCLEELLGAMARSGISRDGSAPDDVRSLLDALPELVERIAQETKELAAAQEAAERQRAEEAPAERDSRAIVDTIPGLVAILTPAGEVDVVNQEFVEYCGQPLEALRQWRTNGTVHVEDLPRIDPLFTQAIASGEPHDFEARIRRFDGVYRWCLVRGLPFRNPNGGVTRWHVVFTDIDERKRAESVIRASERKLRLIIDTIPALAWSARPDGAIDFFNRHYLEFLGLSTEQVKDRGWTTSVHPNDLDDLEAIWQRQLTSERQGQAEARLRRHDGEYRWFLFRADPLRDEKGSIIKWYGVNTDIEDRKRAEALLDAEKRLLEMVASQSPLPEVLEAMCRLVEAFIGNSTCSILLIDSKGVFRHGAGPSLPPGFAEVVDGVPVAAEAGPCGTAASSREQVIVPDLGSDPRWVGLEFRNLLLKHGLRSACSTPIISLTGGVLGTLAIYQREPQPPSSLLQDLIARFVHVASIAIERAIREADLSRSQARVRRLVDANIIGIFIWELEGRILEANDAFLGMVGYDRQDLGAGRIRWTDLTPPEWHERDARATAEVKTAGSVQSYEKEFFRKDGSRMPALLGGALFPEGGNEGVAFVLDLSEQKRAEAEIRALKDELQRENLVLRDEVDRTSMFEEIVGTSSTLQPVLARVAKVAKSESTVLVTGETGTGKELIARAIHRRSARASHPFVGVNCAAVPRELIGSDLFGHEKGAFTGATQRRLGRFELAHGGTIFLDEVGDLPMETQVLLLRVLQEREFERVGGNASIRVDVRVIAATNRDLQAAIEEGTFRSDLFYRLNVFPIAMPALRQRVDDIPLLVEYFIDRYARKLGKTFRRVNKRTLNHLRSYPWPGNVRELQNVIERSVIVCDTDEFRVDESWLSAKPATEHRIALPGTLAAQEKAMIEDALRASEGRVFGPAGAAARLGIPRSTLESRIRALNIDKGRFRTRLVKR